MIRHLAPTCQQLSRLLLGTLNLAATSTPGCPSSASLRFSSGPGPLGPLQQERPNVEIFDGDLKARHRDRAAYLAGDKDPLLDIVTERLLDRLEDCKRKFPHAAVIGGAAEYVMRQLVGGRAGIEKVTYMDTSQDMLNRVQAKEQEARALSSRDSGSSGQPHPGAWPEVEYVRIEGELLPTEPQTFDLVVSSLGLHWFNDLPTMVAQCRFALKPDGLLLAALMGGDTLQELRIACSLAQMEVLGGVSPVVSPLAQVRDAGNLLTRADLAMPTVDLDTFKLFYPCPTDVAAAVYRSMFGEDGSVPATYQVMFMTGWAPHEAQQQPLARGSATVSFQELADGLVQQGGVGGSEAGNGAEEGPEGAGTSPDPNKQV